MSRVARLESHGLLIAVLMFSVTEIAVLMKRAGLLSRLKHEASRTRSRPQSLTICRGLRPGSVAGAFKLRAVMRRSDDQTHLNHFDPDDAHRHLQHQRHERPPASAAALA
jgi:hypothetical protein